MMSKDWARSGLGWGLVAAVALVVAGCGQTDTKSGQAKDGGKTSPVAAKGHSDDDGHDHGKKEEAEDGGHGWWCDYHGVLEAECSQCIPAVEKACKAKGDWCKEHNRAESQCFLCNPKLKEKYAGLYRAKYGKEPPPTDDEKAEQKKKTGKAG